MAHLVATVQPQSGPSGTGDCWHSELLQTCARHNPLVTMGDSSPFSEVTLHRLLLQHYEILPACLGLPFKDLSDSRSGWEQQDELGNVFLRKQLPSFVA